MDALSALASIAGSNAIAGIGAPAATSANQGPVPAPVTPPASVSVFLSDFAQSLLAQQADDPTLDIDTAFARSVLGLSQDSSTDGVLFTSTGALQPFTPALVLAQPADTTGSTDVQSPEETAAQAVLTSEESLTSIQDDTSTQTSDAVSADTPASAPAVTPSNAADTQTPVVTTATNTDTSAGQNTAVTQQATSTDVTAPTDVEPATNTPTPTAENGNVIAADTATLIAQNQVAADNLDPFQQAALISGLTSFGREQSAFIRAPSDLDQSVIEGIAAIMPVGARGNDSTEAWLSARR